MLLKLILFECRFHAKSSLFRAATLVYFLVGLAVAVGSPGANVYKNSPSSLTFLITVLSLGSVISVSLIAGGAILRDREHKMEGIIYSTALTHAQYVVSRFVGLVAASFISFSACIPSLYIARFMPWVDPASMQGYSLLPYLHPLLIMGLPNILLVCSLIFTTAALTKSSMATYLSGFLLYVMYWTFSMMGNSPLMAANSLSAASDIATAAMLEPYGLISYMDQTRYWTIAQKNTEFLSLTGPLLFNRLLWTGFALSLFAMTYRLFTFREMSRKVARIKIEEDKAPIVPIDYSPVETAKMNVAGSFRVFLAQAKMSLKTTVRGFPFYGLLILWALLTVITCMETIRGNILDSILIPETSFFVASLLEPLLKLGAVVVIFYASELLFSERMLGMDGLQEATPANNITFVSAKIAALATLIGILVAYTIILAVGVQLSLGHTDLNLGLYASLFYRVGVPLVALGILTIGISNFFSNKYLGMGLSFVLLITCSGFFTSAFLNHPMLRFGFLPEFRYSDMVGLAYGDEAANWYMMYWAALSGVFLSLALRYWRRGPMMSRVPMSSGGRWLAGLSVVLLLVSGGYLVIQLHYEQTYRTRNAWMDWREEYERTYAADEDVHQPKFTSMDLKVDLYPKERRYTVRGTMAFVNHTEEPLSELLVAMPFMTQNYKLHIEGATELASDTNYGHVRFQLPQPLTPEESSSLEVELEVIRSAFGRLDAENYVLPTASYVEIDKVLPFFGFNSANVITDPEEREKRGLKARKTYPEADHHTHHTEDWGTYQLVISTSEGQGILAPGKLGKQWQEGDRQYVRYTSTTHVPLRLGIASGTWEKREHREGDYLVTAYYHPGHDRNVDNMIAGTAATLKYGATHFSPYEDDTFRIIEIPSFSDQFAATAYNNLTYAVENRLYQLDQRKDTIDMGFRIAHEIGHHWWGYQISPSVSEGVAMLTELLAVYTETVVYDQVFPESHRYEYLDRTADLYFYIRGFEEDVEHPLTRVQFQPYVYYFKGAHVVHGLRYYLGEAGVNEALSQFLKDFHYPAVPKASDLAERLIAAAPEKYRHEVVTLLEEVVTYDLKLKEAVAVMGDVPAYDIQVQVESTTIDRDGTEETQPWFGVLEVAFHKEGKLISTAQLDLKEGQQTYRLQGPEGADLISIDPNYLRLEIDRTDNQLTVSQPES